MSAMKARREKLGDRAAVKGTMLQAHDPSHFERVLRQRVAYPLTLDCLQGQAA